MHKNKIKIVIAVLLAFSPLLYFEFRPLLPSYSRRPLAYEIIFFAPFILYGLTAFLGLKLNQSRIFFTAIFWAGLYFSINAVNLSGIDIKFHNIQLIKFLALSSPIVLIFLFLFKEKYILGWSGALRLLIVAVPIMGCIWLANKIAPGRYPFLTGKPIFNFEFWNLPDFTILLIIILAVFLLLQKDKSIQKFKLSIYVNLLPLILSFNFAAGRKPFDVETSIFSAFSFSVMGFVFLYALYQMYWEKVYIDELTGVPNRRAFDEYLKKLGKKYVVAMIDVDYFKKFNDSYGHSEGDNVLRFVAKHIADNSGGAAFRYGGEEFSVIYRGMEIKYVLNMLDQMRDNLAASDFYLRSSEEVRKLKTKKSRKKTQSNNKTVKVTISIGVAQKTLSKKDAQDVIDTADKALYRAKDNGRNRCEVIYSR
ncbi:MAG TPA: GGDEF domain-containing protein [Caldithrix sp.]|nr:GGDEF domain-containing protein [Caldithrix sp.]